MRYLMFAVDNTGNEFCHVISAQYDDMAVDRMKEYLLRHHSVPSCELAVIAGVWEKDDKFYTANKLADLDWE